MQSTNKRPLSVTIIGCILVVTGIIGSAIHLTELGGPHGPEYDALWAVAVSLVAVLSGVSLLRRRNWARWLAVAWIAFHVVLSLQSRQALLVHTVLLAVFAYVLFRPAATAYFRAATET